MLNAGATSTSSVPTERQLTLQERFDELALRAKISGPAAPARGIFFVVLALMALGFIVQASHLATTVPRSEFDHHLMHLVQFRLAGLVLLVAAYRVGPRRIERFVPLLVVLVIGLLIAVFIPGLGKQVNGSSRWVDLPLVPFDLQPSEFARVAIVLWVARRCTQLGPLVEDARRGYIPMLLFGLGVFLLILVETDLGGSLLFLICFISTLWMAGARARHVTTSMALVSGMAILLGTWMFEYVRERISIFIGDMPNPQLEAATEAVSRGGLWGMGLAQGSARTMEPPLPYQQTDFAFSLVGEELGLFGMLLIIGLFIAYLHFSFKLVSSIEDRFSGLAAFGLLISVAFQAMLHMQVVTGLAPPKGMNMPFISEGGSALFASCLAVGLAIGAARSSPSGSSSRPTRPSSRFPE